MDKTKRFEVQYEDINAFMNELLQKKRKRKKAAEEEEEEWGEIKKQLFEKKERENNVNKIKSTLPRFEKF